MTLTRLSSSCLLFLLVALPLTAGDDPEPPWSAEKEMKRLQGEWKMVAREQEGKPTTEEQLKKTNWMMTIKGDLLLLTIREGKKPNERLEYTIKLDPSAKPRAMDWKYKGSEVVLPCIYKLQGDTLTIRRPLAKPERPAKLETSSGGDELAVWKRVKK